MPTIADKMTRNNFGELMTPIHKKIFFDSYEEKPAQYLRVFKKDTMKARQETYPHLGTFGMWDSNQEGATFNLKKIGEGPRATFTATRYDASYELTWELMQDDQYAVFKGIGKGGNAKALGKGLRSREEQNCANVILNGFTTIGYDGVPLFSENHPLVNSNDKGCNLIYGALNDENLKKALTILRGQKDEAGLPIQAIADKLVVHPNLEFTARALVESFQKAGTNDNDINTLPRLEVIVMDYLFNDMGLVPWFIMDSSFENLMFLEREAALFRSEQIPATMDWRMAGYSRFAEGYVDWRGIVGSYGGVGTLPEGEELGVLNITLREPTPTNTIVYAVTPGATAGQSLKYKVGKNLTMPILNEVATDYSTLNVGIEIPVTEEGQSIIVVVVDEANKIKRASPITEIVLAPQAQ